MSPRNWGNLISNMNIEVHSTQMCSHDLIPAQILYSSSEDDGLLTDELQRLLPLSSAQRGFGDAGCVVGDRGH